VEMCSGREGKAANACSQADLDQTDAGHYLHGAGREPLAVRAPRVNGVPVDQRAASQPLRVRRWQLEMAGISVRRRRRTGCQRYQHSR
jgi:hypothetical protein